MGTVRKRSETGFGVILRSRRTALSWSSFFFNAERRTRCLACWMKNLSSFHDVRIMRTTSFVICANFTRSIVSKIAISIRYARLVPFMKNGPIHIGRTLRQIKALRSKVKKGNYDTNAWVCASFFVRYRARSKCTKFSTGSFNYFEVKVLERLVVLKKSKCQAVRTATCQS